MGSVARCIMGQCGGGAKGKDKDAPAEGEEAVKVDGKQKWRDKLAENKIKAREEREARNSNGSDAIRDDPNRGELFTPVQTETAKPASNNKKGDVGQTLTNNKDLLGASMVDMQNRNNQLAQHQQRSADVANQGSKFAQAAKKIKGGSGDELC